MASRADRRREQRRGTGGGGSSSNSVAWILGGVALLAVLIVAWRWYSSFTDKTARGSVPVEYESPQQLIEMAQGVSEGNPDAPVTLMEFGDYQCPACQNFFRQADPLLKTAYIDPGRIHFMFYDFPLEDAHPNAFLAARAARCAGDQDAYWQFHDTLYQNQVLWSNQADPSGAFAGYAGDLGLDQDAFRACLNSDRYVQLISASQLLAVQLGAQSTPTVILYDGSGVPVRVDNWSTDLRPKLDSLLALAGDTLPATAGAVGSESQ